MITAKQRHNERISDAIESIRDKIEIEDDRITALKTQLAKTLDPYTSKRILNRIKFLSLSKKNLKKRIAFQRTRIIKNL